MGKCPVIIRTGPEAGLSKQMQPGYHHYCTLKKREIEFLQLHLGSEIPSRESKVMHQKNKEKVMSMCILDVATITDGFLGERIIKPTADVFLLKLLIKVRR